MHRCLRTPHFCRQTSHITTLYLRCQHHEACFCISHLLVAITFSVVTNLPNTAAPWTSKRAWAQTCIQLKIAHIRRQNRHIIASISHCQIPYGQISYSFHVDSFIQPFNWHRLTGIDPQHSSECNVTWMESKKLVDLRLREWILDGADHDKVLRSTHKGESAVLCH